MPTLNWIGKDAVISHHKEVPFRPYRDRARHCPRQSGVNPLVRGEGQEGD